MRRELNVWCATFALLVATSFAGNASAANKYSIQETVEATGSIGGATFTRQLIDINGQGIANAPTFVYGYAYSLMLSTLNFSGFLDSGASFSSSSIYGGTAFSDPTDGGAGISFGSDILDTYNAAFYGFDLNGSIGPVAGPSTGQTNTLVPTKDGVFDITEFNSEATFQEVVTPIASTAPEPTTWALMISGIGMVGAALRFGRRSGSIATA